MLVLAFDTATPAVTVAVGSVEPATEGVMIRAARTEVATNRHGELLAPLIADVLATAGVTPADLGAVAVGLGPGPFTGLRVGIVTAKAISDALRIPAYASSSLHLISRSPSTGVATNARRKQVYWAIRAASGFLAGPEIGSPEDAAEQFAAADVPQVAGEGPRLYPEAFAQFLVLEDRVYPSAERLITQVSPQVRAGAASDDLTPMYLRRPDAQPPGKPKLVTPV